MPAHSKKLRPYPPILGKPRLRKEGKARLEPLRLRLQQRKALLEAVWRHFDLASGDWKGLAERLLARHVPAFKSENRGKAKDDLTKEEWDEFLALDNRHHHGEAVWEYVQARLVVCVNEAAKSEGKEAAFRLLVEKPNGLPTRYRKRKTPQSLKQAYRQVPKYIRDLPEQCIPGTPQYEANQRIKAQT